MQYFLLSGTAERMEVETKGISRLKGENLQTNELEFSTSGNTKLSIHVIESVKGKAKSNSKVYLTGNPEKVMTEQRHNAVVKMIKE